MAKILIADDDVEVREMICRMLSREGHEMISAGDGHEADAAFKREAPDLVITDIIMPEKEGLEMVWELKRDHPGCKIIAISGGGRADPADYLNTALALGADRILAKPFERRELLAIVDELLSAAKTS